MAATYIPNNAFAYAKAFIKNMPLDTVQYRVLDSVNKMIWMYAPWRWSIGTIAAINLAASTQDYPFPVPSDFLYGLNAELTDQAGGAPRTLSVEPIIHFGGLVGQPSRVAYSGTPGLSGVVRVLPIPGPTLPTPAPAILSTYKKSAPTITASNANNAGVLVMDDEWAWVFETGVLWLAYQYADDPRAGTSNADSKGNFAYTGQRALFEDALKYMKDHEKLMIIDRRIAPDMLMDR